MTPGWQTSEFWKSLMVTAVGCAVVFVGVMKSNWEIIAVGAGLAGVTQGTYNIGRSMVKSASQPEESVPTAKG